MTETQLTWAPLEVGPSDAGVPATVAGLAEYLTAAGPALDERLLTAKALVFRGFGVTEATLDPVLDRLLADRLSYVHGNSPRTKVGANVYTSTEYPAEFTISMHNELSYSAAWPARLLFFCAQAATTGGATSVVDAAHWLRSLDDEVRAAYADGVRYTQNLHSGFGLGKSWQETFETTERDQVEEFLREARAEWVWKRDGGLRIGQVRPSTTRHPVTGEEVWFNQSDQWHPAALGGEGVALAKLLPADELPQSVSFADGRPIPDAYVLQVRDRGLAGAVDVDWRQGDLLVIDNVLVAHGRRPYSGKRRVLVAMSN
ncbi:TauD/TfdA family dioxygenase [Kitasatospora sp. MAP5-34]|uniref:TauD/TfdA family dioxygenase n=1 Tax=Kitasatospora sp. MAP5-34 TaxID=3035102 RepID=UPI0024764FC4|nr:TauD/TfdA family dioxygenase [Kitasatospora sp. MAP5-34]MDH6576347.1 alpha-ketoglutarate-dependent taurine dioxygenase [Kitasatospora sp. MAP5-34]